MLSPVGFRLHGSIRIKIMIHNDLLYCDADGSVSVRIIIFHS